LNDTNGHNLETQLKEYFHPRRWKINDRRARYTHCDVTSWESQSALFKGVHKRNGRIDIVIANAGIVERKEFLDDELTENGELKQPDISVINVNLVGCMYTGKLALWWFKQNPAPGGALVLISSVGGYADGNLSLNLLTNE
jgi:NAD(P)-dependent dehydrogenase (short-subunit alcohol dehydrogenase family)